MCNGASLLSGSIPNILGMVQRRTMPNARVLSESILKYPGMFCGVIMQYFFLRSVIIYIMVPKIKIPVNTYSISMPLILKLLIQLISNIRQLHIASHAIIDNSLEVGLRQSATIKARALSVYVIVHPNALN